MKMQKKLSNGSYVDVSPEYQINLLNAAIAFDQKYPDTYRGKLGLASVEDAIKYLEQGRELRFGSDWYNQIRDNEAHERQLAAARTKRDNDPNYSDTGWKLDCGCVVHWRSHIMNASMGTSCTDCYDRMSN